MGSGVPVLQQLLTPQMTEASFERGQEYVGGPVVEAGAILDLDSPQDLLRAFGYEATADLVHAVRFSVPYCATFERPSEDRTPRPWPT